MTAQRSQGFSITIAVAIFGSFCKRKKSRLPWIWMNFLGFSCCLVDLFSSYFLQFNFLLTFLCLLYFLNLFFSLPKWSYMILAIFYLFSYTVFFLLSGFHLSYCFCWLDYIQCCKRTVSLCCKKLNCLCITYYVVYQECCHSIQKW